MFCCSQCSAPASERGESKAKGPGVGEGAESSISGPPALNRTRAERLQCPSPPGHLWILGDNVVPIKAGQELPQLLSGYFWWQPPGALLVPVPFSPPGHHRQPWGEGFSPRPVPAFSAIPILSARNALCSFQLPRHSPRQGCPIHSHSFELPQVWLESQGGEETVMAIPLFPSHHG